MHREETAMTEEQKNWIDNASYEQLLSRWRRAPVGDPMFQGDTANYYSEVMHSKGEQIGDAERVRVSKAIGH
jgi:hypothetical protein